MYTQINKRRAIMKNNIFKTENKFAREQKQLNKGVAQKFEIKEIDFPELCVEKKDQSQNKNHVQTNSESVVQYKSVVLKINDVEYSQKNDLKPGWVKLYYDKNSKIVMEKYEENIDSQEDFHSYAQKRIQTLIDKWETERLQYNSVYGEGEYERMYYMSRREEDNFSDADSDDECASVEDANEEECNEDSQYYDLY